MDENLRLILSVAVLHLLACASPGPNFILIVRNSLAFSRAAGIYTALGVSLGSALHGLCGALGVSVLLNSSPVIFSSLKVLGGSYLILLSIQFFRSSWGGRTSVPAVSDEQMPSVGDCLKMGFVTSATNPKVALFFISVFTVLVPVDVPPWVLGATVINVGFAAALWYVSVALAFSHSMVLRLYGRIERGLDVFLGVCMGVFGLKVLLLAIT